MKLQIANTFALEQQQKHFAQGSYRKKIVAQYCINMNCMQVSKQASVL